MTFLEIYTIQQGDTVNRIAAQYGVSPQRIITDNALSSEGAVTTGQALLILRPAEVHTFSAGETIYSVAQRYGTTVMQLYRNNPLLIGMQSIPYGMQIVVAYQNPPSQTIHTCGFAYDFINMNTLRAALPYLTYLISFGYGFNDDGSIIQPDDYEIISAAHRFQTSVLLSLTSINMDGTFTVEKIERLVTDIPFQNRVISNLIDIITEKNAQGLDIDMEYVPAQYRDDFSAFVKNAAEQLHTAGLILHVDLAPKYSADQIGTLYEAHDYPALGAASDFVFLMTYEWGYAFGPPMAVAPLNNVRRVLEYALTEISADKILLGMPNYGYDWSLPFVQGTRAETIGNVYAANLAVYTGSEILFDETAQSPYFYYTSNDGAAHVVWFEDVRSMNAKYSLVAEKGIAGCGYWNIMRPFPQNYLLLNQKFRIEKVYP